MRIPSISKHAVAVLALVIASGSVPMPAHAQNYRDDRYDRYGHVDPNGMYDRSGNYIGARVDVNARYDRNGRYDPNGMYDRSGRYLGARVEVTARYDRNGRYDPNGMYDRSGRYIGNVSYRDNRWNRGQTGMVVFRRPPRMRLVSGTQVYVVDRNSYSTNDDVFRYGNAYYVYRDGDWYMARSWRGPFFVIDERRVPMAFHRVPRQTWRSYPSGWMNTRYGAYNNNDNGDRGYGDRGYVEGPRMVFRSEPTWRMVPGSGGVYVVNRAYGETDYDAFRYGGTYYVYDDSGNWFRADSWRGPFVTVDDRDVPVAFRSVPRAEWRNDPSIWLRVNVR